MKTIKFDARFKEAILNKEKVATIRNSKKVDVGEVFEIVVDNEVVGKAECKQVEDFKVVFFLRHLGWKHIAGENWIYFSLSKDIITHYDLGFNSWLKALHSYEEYLKNKLGYLHIFELMEG